MIFMTSMIDPKQENKVTDFTQERIDALNNTIANLERDMIDARAEIIKYQRMHEDSVRDHEIMMHMLHHLVTVFVERQNEDIVSDALEYAHGSSGYDYEVIAEIVDRLAICDPALCEREYTVSVTVPVTVSLSVRATSASEAEERAHDEIDMNGLDNYQMDYSLSYDAEFYTEEA